MNIEPYPNDVPCAGPKAPKCEQIDELLELLATIRHRWGNTAIKYSIQWGGSALWADDADKQKIRKLEAKIKRLTEKLRAALGDSRWAGGGGDWRELCTHLDRGLGLGRTAKRE